MVKKQGGTMRDFEISRFDGKNDAKDRQNFIWYDWRITAEYNNGKY